MRSSVGVAQTKHVVLAEKNLARCRNGALAEENLCLASLRMARLRSVQNPCGHAERVEVSAPYMSVTPKGSEDLALACGRRSAMKSLP